MSTPRSRSWGSPSTPARPAGKNGKKFTSFLPAVSKDALNKISAEVRRSRMHRRIWHTIGSLAREINPIMRGWMQYYGRSTAPPAAPPAAHQLLPDALAPQEIQAAGTRKEGLGMLATPHPPVPQALRPLGMGALFLVVRMTGAV